MIRAISGATSITAKSGSVADLWRALDGLDTEETEAAYRAVMSLRAKREVDATVRLERDRARASLQNVEGGTTVVYEALSNSDLTEGRGGATSAGLFVLKEHAAEVNAGLPGVMGAPNDIKVRPRILYLSVADWRDSQ